MVYVEGQCKSEKKPDLSQNKDCADAMSDVANRFVYTNWMKPSALSSTTVLLKGNVRTNQPNQQQNTVSK